MDKPDYSQWSNPDLIARVESLEAQLLSKNKQLVFQASLLATSANEVDRYDPSSRAIASSPQPKSSRVFNASRYSTRHIALKFAYLGQNYNGFEYHTGNDTPLPTVEEKLWKALNKAKLIFPTPDPAIEEGHLNWTGCEYSKCGRTDRGVSAFGQVIGIRVRSNRPLPPPAADPIPRSSSAGSEDNEPNAASGPLADDGDGLDSPTRENSTNSFNPITDELPYTQILNRLLPPDIRILAWCPDPPPNFSARFSCRERRYKYFFTNPAFTPTPHQSPSSTAGGMPNNSQKCPEGWLDIDRMRTAAPHFTGLHDFRNFCKVDPSKQIENFSRRIFHADIEGPLPASSSSPNFPSPFAPDPTSPSSSTLSSPHTPTANSATPELYAFTLHGSAFLWHQVRHMVAILFLIGQGLESPALIPALLDVTANPAKPQYDMADDAPLVLWDCLFPDLADEGSERPTESKGDAMAWRWVGEENRAGGEGGEGRERRGWAKDAKWGVGGLVPEMWKVWRRRKMDEVLAGSLLNLTLQQGHEERASEEGGGGGNSKGRGSDKVFLGGDSCKLVGKYCPIMERPRLDSVEVINRRYVKRMEAQGKKVWGADGRTEESPA